MSSRAAARRYETRDAVAANLAQMFKLLADETRLRILRQLAVQGEQHVRALCAHLEQSQPAVSHHLALLKSAGMIDLRRSGKHNYYRLTAPWLAALLEQASRSTDLAVGPHMRETHSTGSVTPARREPRPLVDLSNPDYDSNRSSDIHADAEPAELLV